MDGSQKIKRIVFDKSGTWSFDQRSSDPSFPFFLGPSKRKNEREAVNRISSYSSRSSSSITRTISVDVEEDIEDACLICTDRPATHEYDPCKHLPMCGECVAQLKPEQHQQCMLCFQPATIHIRVPKTPSS